MRLQKGGIVAVLLSLACSCFAQGKSATAPVDFIIDAGRAYVYLLFDHSGAGVQRNDAEPRMRLWFRMVNNCRVPVVVHTNGVPAGSLPNEVGLNYTVTSDEQLLSITSEVPLSTPVAQEESRNPEMPTGHMSEVSSSVTIDPGASILFSIPVNDLSPDWHIEIPYWFGLKDAHTPRPPVVGGEPRMVLTYGTWDLPEEVKKTLPKR
jgi:hypothetical protein